MRFLYRLTEHSENLYSKIFLSVGGCSYFIAKLLLYYHRGDHSIQVPDNSERSE